MNKVINDIINSSKRGGRTPLEIAEKLIAAGATKRQTLNTVDGMNANIEAKLKARNYINDNLDKA